MYGSIPADKKRWLALRCACPACGKPNQFSLIVKFKPESTICICEKCRTESTVRPAA